MDIPAMPGDCEAMEAHYTQWWYRGRSKCLGRSWDGISTNRSSSPFKGEYRENLEHLSSLVCFNHRKGIVFGHEDRGTEAHKHTRGKQTDWTLADGQDGHDGESCPGTSIAVEKWMLTKMN